RSDADDATVSARRPASSLNAAISSATAARWASTASGSYPRVPSGTSFFSMLCLSRDTPVPPRDHDDEVKDHGERSNHPLRGRTLAAVKAQETGTCLPS